MSIILDSRKQMLNNITFSIDGFTPQQIVCLIYNKMSNDFEKNNIY